MPHRIQHIITILHTVEYITLNILSLGWITLSTSVLKSDSIATVGELISNTDWVTKLIGLSIVFFNVARGIKALRKDK